MRTCETFSMCTRRILLPIFVLRHSPPSGLCFSVRPRCDSMFPISERIVTGQKKVRDGKRQSCHSGLSICLFSIGARAGLVGEESTICHIWKLWAYTLTGWNRNVPFFLSFSLYWDIFFLKWKVKNGSSCENAADSVLSLLKSVQKHNKAIVIQKIRMRFCRFTKLVLINAIKAFLNGYVLLVTSGSLCGCRSKRDAMG